MQNCFSPTGALAVPSFLSVLPVINRLHSLPLFSLVALSQDWHPPNHVSFAANWPGGEPFAQRELQYDAAGRLCHHAQLPASVPALTYPCAPGASITTINQTLWPTHCVAERDDSNFHPALLRLPGDLVVRKGQSAALESYSAFTDVAAVERTALPGRLAALRIERLYVAGVAFEVCVAANVWHALAEGLEVVVVEDAVAGLNPKAIAEERAAMAEAGVRFVRSEEVPGWAGADVEAVLEQTMRVEVAVQ